ncbi:hypothetical protein BEL04_19500 [Mucilaginibacter sp. PPCGB 2223]|uniref:nuclear transport factor 2 family protein n=1 Tax=Mucilaginibacter sp. PPCGB 2223 TaxID=1886027 RepID=UPI00082564FA|nr:nuclear transport factor 2 family protein [Mucilaginibacter sp. PPCGB 2223]OCX50910.1 hypothetical protein BEL04_19500 [Mucilaginibacter sp. PPCGB 2223]
MKNSILGFLGLLCACLMVSCNSANQTLVAEQQAKVRTEVQQFADSIATGITKNGPMAWLKYFGDSPGFFMASDGQLVFRDRLAAEQFITGTLVKTISRIDLQWNNIRVDPLSPDIAVIAAGFHEDLTDNKGKLTGYGGYFTGVAQKTDKGWQLRDAHWSIKH